MDWRAVADDADFQEGKLAKGHVANLAVGIAGFDKHNIWGRKDERDGCFNLSISTVLANTSSDQGEFSTLQRHGHLFQPKQHIISSRRNIKR